MTNNDSSTEAPSSEKQANQWAMFLHLSVFLGYVIPFAGLIAPIVIWQLKKEEFPKLDAHAKNLFNFMIIMLIALVICFVLMFVLIGILLIIPVVIYGVVCPIYAGIKANNGEIWEYPYVPKLIK